MRQPLDPVRQPWLRRTVFGVALTLALAFGLCQPQSPVSLAAAADAPASSPPAPATGKARAGGDSAAAPAAPATRSAKAAAAPKADAAASDSTDDPAADAADATDSSADSEVTIDHRGIVVNKGGKRVRIGGLGVDREYDSFRDFVNDAPWLAALVFMLVLLFFLTPLLILVLVIWYKMRKARMQNETMLKLAERGVVPPAEAMQTLSGQAPPGGIPPSAAPLYEQARQLRRRAAWSDLRRGVVLIAVGLGFMFYSMFADGEPNWVGLICFFLGIGYCVLWVFEERQGSPAQRDAGVPPAGSA